MADMDVIIQGIGLAGALGTAAYGLVDGTKFIAGGISRAGFGYVSKAITRFTAVAAPTGTAFGAREIVETLRANWMNGMAKPDQKATARSLIRLTLKPASAGKLAELTGVHAAHLQSAAQKIQDDLPLDESETKALGAFDVALGATLDLGYERGDQFYRNAAKILAGAIALLLSIAAWYYSKGPSSWQMAVLVGLVATPLAPVAKDLTSALQSAAKAVGSFKR